MTEYGEILHGRQRNIIYQIRSQYVLHTLTLRVNLERLLSGGVISDTFDQTAGFKGLP